MDPQISLFFQFSVSVFSFQLYPNGPLVIRLLLSIQGRLAREKGPFTPPKSPLLVNDATYAVKRVMSIIKEEDIDDCDKYAPIAIRESGLHDLAKVFPFHLLFLFIDTHYSSPSYSFARLSFR